MLRVVSLACLLVAVVATPALIRSREEIEAFRSFLENSKSSDDQFFLARSKAAPQANAEELSGHFEGDIILDDWMINNILMEYSTGRNAYTWPDTHWPHNTVVWEFGEGEFGPLQQAAILEGIADIERHSCVKFRYREPEDTVYVRVTGSAGGCFAHVGHWAPRGVHTLNLARNTPGVGCFRHATIVHEWKHILGFFHMQSTHNRDDYVRIVPENLIAGTEHNFEIYGPDLVSNLDVEYDYVSCMHYSAYAFSSNGEKTIVALQEHEGQMGQRLFITDKDWLRINRHYSCPGAWDSSESESSEETSEESSQETSEEEPSQESSEESSQESPEESSQETAEEKSEESKEEPEEESEEAPEEPSEENVEEIPEETVEVLSE